MEWFKGGKGLGARWAQFRQSPAFPRMLWAYTIIALGLHWTIGLDKDLVIFLAVLSIEASLSNAYISQDNKANSELIVRVLKYVADNTEAQLEILKELRGRHEARKQRRGADQEL